MPDANDRFAKQLTKLHYGIIDDAHSFWMKSWSAYLVNGSMPDMSAIEVVLRQYQSDIDLAINQLLVDCVESPFDQEDLIKRGILVHSA